MSLERTSGAAGQVAYLQKKAEQLAYAEEARQRPRPPLDSVVAQQGAVSEMRRDAADHVSRADLQKPALREQRMARQGAFLDSRKVRHDEACVGYERDMDSLAEQCQLHTQEASARMKARVDEAIAQTDALLDPLEKTTELLGEKTEEEVRGVLAALDQVVEQRRAEIAEFASELEAIDTDRREKTISLLQGLAEALTQHAHAVPGEIERLVEQKTLDLDAVLLENQKAVKVLNTKLLVQALEASKANKLRWHKGFLLWKQKRHIHSVDLVMQRIHSPEFEQPPVLVELLGHVRQQQLDVFEGRTDLIRTFFATPLKRLLVSTVRNWEERNTSLNDKAQDSFDRLFEDLKSFKDGLNTSAETMLGQLAHELETHDARAEWGEHESVADLIGATIQPPLQERLDATKDLLTAVISAVSKQEETQHHAVTQLLAFFLNLAKKGEQLKKQTESFETEYHGEIDDCIHEFDGDCEKNEGIMKGFREKIEDAAHYDALDELKQQAFSHLNGMEQHYREHSNNLLGIHNRYPGHVASFIREQTGGFCEELGLTLAPAPFKPDEEADPEAQAAAEEAANAAAAEAEAFAEWPEGSGTGFTILERTPLSELREKVLAAPPPSVDDAGGAEGGAGAETATLPPDAAEGEAEASAGAGAADEVPRLRDGSAVLELLSFEAEWLEDNFGAARMMVFVQLAANRKHLDQVDVTGTCEEVRRQLDQRLRRHTNRKGEVQVEWYVPRYGAVAKHKDKFERHLVDVARKSQGHDDEFDELAKEMEAAEQGYQEKLQGLRDKLGEAETLPMLTAFERQAGDVAHGFEEACHRIMAKMLNLATKAPQELQNTNKAFLAMCRRGEEQYSQTEILFYSGEIEELNGALDKKAQARSARRAELEGELDGKKKGPFEAFSENFDEAVEQLCATKGYGKKYGKPRRKAQGLCRTLIAHSATVKQNLGELLEYLKGLCGQSGGEVVDVASLPPFPKCMKTESQTFRLRDFFDTAGEPWVFSAELIGVLYIVVCTLCALGSHLKAFKEERAGLYRLAGVPAIRVLRESEALCAAEGEADEGKAVEQALRTGCLEQVLGQLLKADAFDAEINSIVAEAQKDSQETFKGTVPDFMTKFLEDMKESANVSRLEAARGVRDSSDLLRETVLLGLGDALFGELAGRAIAELRRGTQEAQAQTVATWSEFDARRAAHEQRLSPGLSNPNAEAQLHELIDAEAKRSESALAMAAGDRERMAECLRGAGDSFVQRLSASFECSVRLVDGLPLHTHFGTLPGDEQTEHPRMSIKRRMRHLQNGTSVDQWGDGLPERTWAGLPRLELRALLRAGAWPGDERLAEATEETLQEQMPEVVSFRSPVHKRLFERRGLYYDRYRAEFEAEVKRRDAELAARSEKEEVGERNWQSMVRQLQGDAGNG